MNHFLFDMCEILWFRVIMQWIETVGWYATKLYDYDRLYDSEVDLMQADWSPFQQTAWVMPLLTELSGWREKLLEIDRDIRSRNESAIFMADYPGCLPQS